TETTIIRTRRPSVKRRCRHGSGSERCLTAEVSCDGLNGSAQRTQDTPSSFIFSDLGSWLHMSLLIPISVGELLDKISILEIKSREIHDEAKKENINREHAALQVIRHREI